MPLMFSSDISGCNSLACAKSCSCKLPPWICYEHTGNVQQNCCMSVSGFVDEGAFQICFQILRWLQNPSRAAKSFAGFKILSRLQNALACAKSWVTALRLQNALLASHYLASARNMLWTHEKCSTQKSRILVSGLENEGTFQAVSNFFVGCEIQQGLQNPSRASKSFEGCKILWSVQNPESAAKSFTEASKS